MVVLDREAKADHEADLAELAQSGDSSACLKLIEQYHGAIIKLARRLKPCTVRHEVDDLVNECYLILLHRRMRAFDRSKATFCTWIHWQIYGAMRQVIDATSSERRLQVEFAKPFSMLDSDCQGEIASRLSTYDQNSDDMDDVCSRVSERHAKILRMMSQGYQLKDIALVLRISASRVQQMKVEAFETIRKSRHERCCSST